jgi:hypothetical protein
MGLNPYQAIPNVNTSNCGRQLPSLFPFSGALPALDVRGFQDQQCSLDASLDAVQDQQCSLRAFNFIVFNPLIVQLNLVEPSFEASPLNLNEVRVPRYLI